MPPSCRYQGRCMLHEVGRFVFVEEYEETSLQASAAFPSLVRNSKDSGETGVLSGVCIGHPQRRLRHDVSCHMAFMTCAWLRLGF